MKFVLCIVSPGRARIIYALADAVGLVMEMNPLLPAYPELLPVPLL
jgi:hypothetical protein